MANHIITARALSKRYTDIDVVKSVDFSIAEGECFGFLGPNGAGKTTTMNMILCYSPVTAGELHVFGLDVRRHARKIKGRIGVVPQEENLDPELTVLKNMLVFSLYFGIPPDTARSRAEELLRFVELWDRRGSKINTLSGGMKRRLLIARGLVNRPRLLLLDEPTAGLDPQARHLIWQRLRTLKKNGTTLVLTTHYMEEAAQLCDRTVIMDHGKILAEGSPVDLVEKIVGRDVIELRVEKEPAEEIIRLLHGETFAHEVHADTLYFFSKNGEALFEALRSAGHTPAVRRHANLEDVFLRLTGRELRE